MIEVVQWWLVTELLGLIALPIVFVALPFLPDRGLSLAKVLGLLFASYLLWLLASVGVLPNSRLALVLVILALAQLAIAFGLRTRVSLLAWLRRHWRLVGTIELVYLLTFIAAALLRAYVPEIEHTEQPFEFAFLNAVLRSESFPPADPWLAGETLNYYYFGFVPVAVVARLAGTAPAIAFNLGIVLVTALAATAMFGIVFNLLVRRSGAIRAAGFASLGVLLLLVLGNLEGVFEVLALRDWAPDAVYDWANISGLEGPRGSSQWYPTERWFFWRSTHFTSPWDHREFPFYTLQMGALHAHLLALPLVLTVVGVALNVLRTPLRRFRIGAKAVAAPVVLLALAAGALGAAHSWDFPPALAIIGAAIFGRQLLARRTAPVDWVASSALAAVAVGLSLLLFVPFYATYAPPVAGIVPLEVLPEGAGHHSTRPARHSATSCSGGRRCSPWAVGSSSQRRFRCHDRSGDGRSPWRSWARPSSRS